MNTTSISRPARDLISTVRELINEHREARSAYKALEGELASYTSRREVDDLLGTIRDQHGPDAQQIRDILLNNPYPATGLHRVA